MDFIKNDAEKINVICTHLETGIVSRASLTLHDDWFEGEFDLPVINDLDVKFWFGELFEKLANDITDMTGLKFNIKSI